MKKLVCILFLVALTACGPYVPVKQDTSKNERLQADWGATVALRSKFREQLKLTTDAESKAALEDRIRGLNEDIVSIKTMMGYPASAPDAIDPDAISTSDKAQQDIAYWNAERAILVRQLKVYPDPSQQYLRDDIAVIDRNLMALSRRPQSDARNAVKAALIEYGKVIDAQGLDQSSPGTTGRAAIGSALGSAAYIDNAFRPGNNYSAVAQLGAGLFGAILGAQLDRRPVNQYRIRYALRRSDGEIVYGDAVQQDPFRHPVGMCLRIVDLQPVSQTLCAP